MTIPPSEIIHFRLDTAIVDIGVGRLGIPEMDTDDITLTLEEEDLIESSPGLAHSLFSLDYLADIDRAIPGDSELRLRLGTEIPLAIDFDIAEETGTVEYVLAPRMQSY